MSIFSTGLLCIAVSGTLEKSVDWNTTSSFHSFLISMLLYHAIRRVGRVQIPMLFILGSYKQLWPMEHQQMCAEDLCKLCSLASSALPFVL